MVENNNGLEGSKMTTLFAVRTTIGQEKGVLQLIFNKLKVMNPFPDIKVMMISEQLRGYVFVEAIHQRDVLMLISGVPHIKGKVVGSIQLSSIAHVISPRRVTEVLEEDDVVEIVSGIFQGQKAQVIRMPKEGAKEEVTLRLLDSDSAISIKIHGDFLKLVQKGDKHKDRYVLQEQDVITPNSDEIVTPSTEPISKPEEQSKTEDVIPIVSVVTTPAPQDVYTFEEDDVKDEKIEGKIEPMEQPSKEPSKEKKTKLSSQNEEESEDEWSKFSF